MTAFALVQRQVTSDARPTREVRRITTPRDTDRRDTSLRLVSVRAGHMRAPPKADAPGKERRCCAADAAEAWNVCETVVA
eukprot:scaffold1280_cov246-Pinguiococcus_pyrenoidosus.AAC.19